MIRILAIFVVLAATFPPFAAAVSPSIASTSPNLNSVIPQQIRWHRDFNEGWREAHRRNVPMVIFISSDRCRYCDAMEAQTWCDDEVTNLVNDRFVAIHLNPDENADVLSRIDVEMFPMTLIGMPEGKIVGQLKGFQRPENFRNLLTKLRLLR